MAELLNSRKMDRKQALQKLTALCARREHSSGEMAEKMRQWGVDEGSREQVLEYLIANKYVDDERFARAFTNDKIRYNGWGRLKIEQALWMKGISKEIQRKVLDEIDEKEYLAVLRPLIRQKERGMKFQSPFERSAKLIRFAMGRGFTMDLIHKVIDAEGFVDE